MTHFDDYYEEDRDTRMDAIKRIVIAFVLGGLVSSLVTLFMAPTSGPQARQTVKRTIGEVKDRASQAKDTISHIPGRMRDAVEEAPAKARGKVDAAAQTTKRKASKLKDVAENVIEESKDTLKHGADDAYDVLKSG